MASKEPVITKNKFEPLAKEAEEEPINNNVIQPKIPPIMLRRTAEYREIIKRLNTVHNIKCKAKEAGEFVKLFAESADDVRKLTKYLDEENKEYFVTADRSERPNKVVIKGLPINIDTNEIKNELTELGFRVDKVNQLKKFKTREPLRAVPMTRPGRKSDI